MARMTVEEVYRGEKYGVMSAATADYLNNGRAAEKMKNEGDTVSGMTDSVPPSSYVRWDENDNA